MVAIDRQIFMRPELNTPQFDILTCFNIVNVFSRQISPYFVWISELIWTYQSECKQKQAPFFFHFVLRVEEHVRNSLQQQRWNSFSPICTVHLEIEQKSCGFARNLIKLRRFVVLTHPRRARKIKQSTEIRILKFVALSFKLTMY